MHEEQERQQEEEDRRQQFAEDEKRMNAENHLRNKDTERYFLMKIERK
jgi:hypothetical protein